MRRDCTRMAKKIGHVALIAVLLISVSHGTYADSWDDWTRNLNENIENHVQSIMQNVHRQIESTINHSVRPALEEIERAVESIPKDQYGRVISSGFSTIGNTVIINNGQGQTKSVVSGYTKDGEPFVRQVEERNDGNVLYHYESYFKPRNDTVERTCWKLEYSKPGATPEILKDCGSNA